MGFSLATYGFDNFFAGFRSTPPPPPHCRRGRRGRSCSTAKPACQGPGVTIHVCLFMPQQRSFRYPCLVRCHARYHLQFLTIAPHVPVHPAAPLVLLPPMPFFFFRFCRLVAAGELGVGGRFRASHVVCHGVGVRRDRHSVAISAVE